MIIGCHIHARRLGNQPLPMTLSGSDKVGGSLISSINSLIRGLNTLIGA
jgi:hypothetical protein